MPWFFALMSHVYGVWRRCPNHGEPSEAGRPQNRKRCSGSGAEAYESGARRMKSLMLGDDAGGTMGFGKGREGDPPVWCSESAVQLALPTGLGPVSFVREAVVSPQCLNNWAGSCV